MEDRPSVIQNYRYNGDWRTLKLSSVEMEDLKQLHREYTASVAKQCLEDASLFEVIAPVDRTRIACALFEVRVEKFFTWVQRALEEKTRKARENGGVVIEEERIESTTFEK